MTGYLWATLWLALLAFVALEMLLHLILFVAAVYDHRHNSTKSHPATTQDAPETLP